MEQLYTPWRMKYIASDQQKTEVCVFCAKFHAAAERDRDNLLVYRGPTTFTIMNIYPYNTGHLMILPHQHVASLTDISAEAQGEMMRLAACFTDLLTRVLQPDGFNIGLNLGKAAGAGLGSHLHLHVVPRWSADSNYMSVVANTRVLPQTLEETYDKIMSAVKKNPPQL